jgi:spore germination cell wall hydrolase CwlJ-like protein
MNILDPVDMLARTLWGEARGEPEGGMEGVACVVLNRAHNPRWWGHDVISVCLHSYQFSCWNSDDPNRPKLVAVTEADPDFVRALAIAREALAGHLADITQGADSYADLRVCHPDWADTAERTCRIGNQTFFRVELHAPAAAA